MAAATEAHLPLSATHRMTCFIGVDAAILFFRISSCLGESKGTYQLNVLNLTFFVVFPISGDAPFKVWTSTVRTVSWLPIRDRGTSGHGGA